VVLEDRVHPWAAGGSEPLLEQFQRFAAALRLDRLRFRIMLMV
jgi:hypothetical protein